MGLIANYNCISDESLKELKAVGLSQEGFLKALKSGMTMMNYCFDIDKMWDVLHFVLTGVRH
ncbi:MAG: DUF1877 family protein [Veillonella parvula]